MEAEYVTACEVAKKAVWIRKFLVDLGVMRIVNKSNELRNHRRGKHIERKYHFIRETVS
jgi:hypothetical protein